MAPIVLRTLSLLSIATGFSASALAGQVTPMGPGSGLVVFTAPTIEPTRAPNTGPFSIPFTIQNNGSSNIPGGTVTCILTGPVTCNNVTPTDFPFIPPGGSVGVTVTYSVGAVGSGSIGIRATPDIGNPAEKSRIVTVADPGKAQVSLVNYNPDNLDRSLCLTIGAGEAAGVSCGDLFVTHAMPAYPTLGRERSLSLLYNSAAATGLALVAANVAEPTTIGTPDRIRVILSVGASTDSAEYLPALTYPYDRPRQVVVGRGLSPQPTGIYNFTLKIRNIYPASLQDTTISGTALIVNRSSSNYGSGWSVVGVEELKLAQGGNRLLWLGGDGSARVYDSVASATWRAPAGAFRDTIRYDAVAQTYTRYLRHGVRVVFDALGRHTLTVNRAKQWSRFYWDTLTSRLDSIAVPPHNADSSNIAGTVYRLAYDGNGKLDRITDPAGRILDVTVTAGRLSQLVDPDTALYHTDFVYDGNRLIARTNRRGFTTTYAYANGARVTQVKVPLDTATRDTALTALQSWDERGLAVAYANQAAAETSAVYTQIDGPRTDVVDVAKFWVDRWSAPIRIIDPIGATTVIVRGDPVVPSAITRVTYANGRIAKMIWNSRGNLLELRDSTSHLGSSGLPTTVTGWTYPSGVAQDSPDTIIDAAGVRTKLRYDSLGFLWEATAPNGHVTRFTVIPNGTLKGLVRDVTEASVPAWNRATHGRQTLDLMTTFAFNALGNDTLLVTPMGFATRRRRDAMQRVDTLVDPGGHRTDIVYDKINRMRQTIRHVEGLDSGFTAPLVTQYRWKGDAIDSILDARGVSRSFAHDAALRQIAETDDYGLSELRYHGKAGFVDSVRTRLVLYQEPVVIKNRFDANGRLSTTSWPGPFPAADSDSVVNTYDNMGRLLTATTTTRRVVRTYFANGALASEIQSAVNGQQPSTNRYGYDTAGRRAWYVMGVPGNSSLNDSVSYAYDPLSGALQWIKVRWEGGQRDSVQFWWDPLGRRDSLLYSNGARVRFGYDRDGALAMVCGSHSNVYPAADAFDFTEYHRVIDGEGLHRVTDHTVRGEGYDLTSQGCEGPSVGRPTRNSFDSRHQLVEQVRASDSSLYRYDASGNRTVWRAYTTAGTMISDIKYWTDPGHNRVRKTGVPPVPWTGEDWAAHAAANRRS